MTDVSVTDNTEMNRYEGAAGGQVAGFAEYRRVGDVVVMPHTEVSPEFEGQGVAAQIVRFALDDVRRHGLRVKPQCSYVAMWITRHPEYQGLVAQ